MDSTTLSIKNASGKTFSLLNDNNGFIVNKMTSSMSIPIAPRRKYHCSQPGCNKSFTTSGHLARHNRIHTGEKNFHCLHPGCPSRFSRQDNMMQHYRTHLSQKIRRQQQQQKMLIKQEPQLYNHSFYEAENLESFQPLYTTTTRQRRSFTMPSLPYPPMMMITGHRARAYSTSSSCSSLSETNTLSPPTSSYCYGNEHHQQQQQHHHHQHQPKQEPKSSLYHLANIVSTFG
ncbi:hypothetical protein INT47_012760 [Mucor saturninus]|uniref:C2H2-type domain-containing protein n=1 Tax=Mucor saturninus TaxID=64648 RepID=A0A8H7UVL7_9FUNG|nr:hypothetical protein INT47_012760 [Mucor saturninus]